MTSETSPNAMRETPPNVMREIFLVAGEASGDIYGADLAAALRRADPDVRLTGVGGARMRAAGVECLLDSSEWGLIGWLEALPRLPAFLRRLAVVRGAIVARRPAAVVLIDFPGFNLPLARGLPRGVPCAYILPPMVSTRKGDRARRVARLGMRLLAVFPFEAEAYRQAGGDVVFIGHPAVDRVRPSARPDEIRRRLGLPPAGPVLALFPGSRRQEIERHMPVIAAALPAIDRRAPGVRAILPLADERFRPLVEAALAGNAVPVAITDRPYDALAAADFAVVASGTATLEAMCLGTPMVLIYRLSRSAWWIAQRIASVATAGLPSLLAGRVVVPELLQDACTPAQVASVVTAWLGDPERRIRQRAALLALRGRLGAPGALDRAASEILRLASPHTSPAAQAPARVAAQNVPTGGSGLESRDEAAARERITVRAAGNPRP